jgi:hypothetical protein
MARDGEPRLLKKILGQVLPPAQALEKSPDGLAVAQIDLIERPRLLLPQPRDEICIGKFLAHSSSIPPNPDRGRV